jgi:hypothetical protein
VVVTCKYGDEPAGSGATELVVLFLSSLHSWS